MLKFLILLFYINLTSANTCVELLNRFVEIKKTNAYSSLIYKKDEIESIKKHMEEFGFNETDINSLEEKLSYHKDKVNLSTFDLYLQYINTFRGEKFKSAYLDISQLGQKEIHSDYVLDFNLIHERLPKKYKFYKKQMEFDEFSNLYFSCKSAIPNQKNNNAKKLFSKFSIGLSNLTQTASYTYYHKDDEKNFRWFSELGYELTFNTFTSYLGSKIQTNQNDPQHIKSIKNYFMNRLFGLSDMVLYPVLFDGKSDKAKLKVEELKKSENFQEDIERLHHFYDERGLYTKYKETVVETYKNILNNNGKIEVAGLDWSNLKPSDLDQSEIQEVLTLAATVELYELNRGPLLDTGDSGLDRYAFSSLVSAGLIPRNMIQSYINYQILCMGQHNPALALTKAAVFTSSINFFIGSVFYKARKEAIHQ